MATISTQVPAFCALPLLTTVQSAIMLPTVLSATQTLISATKTQIVLVTPVYILFQDFAPSLVAVAQSDLPVPPRALLALQARASILQGLIVTVWLDILWVETAVL